MNGANGAGAARRAIDALEGDGNSENGGGRAGSDGRFSLERGSMVSLIVDPVVRVV